MDHAGRGGGGVVWDGGGAGCGAVLVWDDGLYRTWDDPRRGKTVVEVEEINQGEPDPAMFEPPPGYTIKQVVPQGPQ